MHGSPKVTWAMRRHLVAFDVGSARTSLRAQLAFAPYPSETSAVLHALSMQTDMPAQRCHTPTLH